MSRPRTRRRKLVILGYFGALALSWMVRSAAPPANPGDGVQIVRLPTLGAAADPEGSASIAYLEAGHDLDGRSPALLIHGSPGSKSDMHLLAARLAQDRRTVMPDLPGFGESSRDISDYSVRAHGEYMRGLLDRLRIGRVHLVGYSLGGGVVLQLADAVPDRVASVTLLSSIGVQEFELLGDYALNHAVHAVQLSALWLLREATPHMGVLDRAFLGVPYARSFYDTDQRPLRGILSRLSMPVLIVHGRGDQLVPIEAAVEHARLVPQSTLHVVDGGHLVLVTQPDQVADPIRDFLHDVERHRALTRERASAARFEAARQPFDPAGSRAAGPLATLILATLLAVATLVSEDLACIGAGMLVAHGRLGFTAGVAGCFAGILIGDLLLFAAGRWAGRGVLRVWPLRRLVPQHALTRGAQWLQDHGARAIVMSRFLPGTRLPTYVAAGVLGLSVWTYLKYFALAAILWTPILVGVAAVATSWTLATGYGWHTLTAVALALGLIAALHIGRLAMTHVGRRRIVSAWRRTTRWEFWPVWAFYPPIVLWILWLGVRHRSFTLFTAANPGIPAGGFLGESKSEILGGLVRGGAPVAPYTLLPGGLPAAERLRTARRFITSHGLPVVLKPDQGQRGEGVVIVRSAGALEGAVSALVADTILQAYVEGPEFGVFYVRHPSSARGQIFSVTAKRLATVSGDGRRTLEQLIRDDPRAVAIADLYVAANDARRDHVPAAGERVQLSELGTHCRGAIFLDGRRLLTRELEAAVDASCRRIDGFYFGRFDVRAGSVADFQVGRFTVLELNGVTSEATHIYDPSVTLWAAYRTLARQWQLAFEIGAENRRRGHAVTPFTELVRLVSSRHHLLPARPETELTLPGE